MLCNKTTKHKRRQQCESKSGYTDNRKNKFYFLFFKRFYLFIFRERGREGEREEEKHRCVRLIGCLMHTPSWGSGLQNRHVPWLGINLWPLVCRTTPSPPSHTSQGGRLTSHSSGTCDVVCIGQMRKQPWRRQGTGLRSNARCAGSGSQMLLTAPPSIAPAWGWGERCGRGRAWARAGRSEPVAWTSLSMLSSQSCPWEAPWGSRQCVPTPGTNPSAHCQGRKRKWPGQGRW